MQDAKGEWVDDLPEVLWSARTTTKEATVHSSFNLVYGSEAILPVEFGIPSPRMTYEFERKEAEKHVNLDLPPETKGNALLRSIQYKQRIN